MTSMIRTTHTTHHTHHTPHIHTTHTHHTPKTPNKPNTTAHHNTTTPHTTHTTVWDKGGIVKTRAPSFRLINHATLRGPPNFLGSTWCTLDSLPITQNDVAAWPYSVDILLVFSSFLASLHWPQGTSDLGKFGISFFYCFLMFEVYSGYRLQAEKTVRPHLRSRRPPGLFRVFQWV